jgi:hypothetical protein
MRHLALTTKILWVSIATTYAFLGLHYTLFLLRVDCSIYRPLDTALGVAGQASMLLAGASFVGALVNLIRARKFRTLFWMSISCAIAVGLFIIAINLAADHDLFYCVSFKGVDLGGARN